MPDPTCAQIEISAALECPSIHKSENRAPQHFILKAAHHIQLRQVCPSVSETSALICPQMCREAEGGFPNDAQTVHFTFFCISFYLKYFVSLFFFRLSFTPVFVVHFSSRTFPPASGLHSTWRSAIPSSAIPAALAGSQISASHQIFAGKKWMQHNPRKFAFISVTIHHVRTPVLLFIEALNSNSHICYSHFVCVTKPKN